MRIDEDGLFTACLSAWQRSAHVQNGKGRGCVRTLQSASFDAILRARWELPRAQVAGTYFLGAGAAPTASTLLDVSRIVAAPSPAFKGYLVYDARSSTLSAWMPIRRKRG